MRALFIVSLFLFSSLISYGQEKDTLIERVEQLGLDLIKYSRSGAYGTGELPKNVAYIGSKTFWKLFEIPGPIASINIIAHDASEIDYRADYILDLGTYLGLRIKYDSIRDKFHVLGYFGTITKMSPTYKDSLRQLDKSLEAVGNIQPGIGLNGIKINESKKDELFKTYNEHFYNRIGLYFDFDENGILKSLYLSSLQFKTDKNIRPQSDIKRSIVYHYGEPESIDNEINVNNRKLGGVKVLNYAGISFVCLGDNLVMIFVK